MFEDTLIVSRPMPKGPSEKVGIVAGDRIVGVNGTTIAGVKMPQDSIMKKLRGPKGTTASLKVVRTGLSDTLTFDVVRDKIPIHTVDAAYMIAPGVGYIMLERFGATSGKEVKELKTSLERIRSAADEMITGIDKALEKQAKREQSRAARDEAR
jgi:carboxyl-terminal processing protease